MWDRWRQWRRQNRIWRSYRVGLLLLRTLFIINRERERVMQARARGDADVQPNIAALVKVLREFRLAAIELGGLMIKLGQFLGARADLLPGDALAELASLHDEVPAEPYAAIVGVLAREWGTDPAEICAVIEKETAGAASLGQVHRARLHDGRDVAIKVQRPGIDAIVRTDLRTFRFVLRVVGWLAPAASNIIDLDLLYREFSRTVAEELDYVHEGQNAERFAALFADDPLIRVPAIIHAYSTRRVLVLEWMEGIKVSQTEALAAAGVDREALAQRLVGSYLNQVLEAGFFHADPHPGNLIIQPDPEGDKLVFIDFGMMGTVTPKLRKGLRDAFSGVMLRNASQLLRGLQQLGFLADSADLVALEPIVETMLTQITAYAAPNGRPSMSERRRSGRRPRPEDAFGDIGATLYDQPFRLPAQFAFFGRMVGILLGIIRTLSPEIDLIEVARPYAQRFIGGGTEGIDAILRLLGAESWQELGQSLLTGGLSTAQSLVALPGRLEHFLDRAERGELRLQVQPTTGPRRRNGRNRRPAGFLPGLLNRPTPLWVPLGVLGAVGAVAAVRSRRGRR